jgi:hypothetical protein
VTERIVTPEASGYGEHDQDEIERIRASRERRQYAYEHEAKGRTDAIYETEQAFTEIRNRVRTDPQYPAGNECGDPVSVVRAEAGFDEPVTNVPLLGFVTLPGIYRSFIKSINNNAHMVYGCDISA